MKEEGGHNGTNIRKEIKRERGESVMKSDIIPGCA